MDERHHTTLLCCTGPNKILLNNRTHKQHTRIRTAEDSEQTHQVSFLCGVSLKSRKSESGGRILECHYTIIVLRTGPRVRAHHVSGTEIKTPLKIASKVSKAPLCMQILLPEQQRAGCSPLPAPTQTHLFVLIRQIPSLLTADDISSKKHVRAKRQDTADTHTQSETPVRPVQGGDAADKPAKASHQPGIVCATAGDAPRRTPLWKAQGSVHPKRPGSYLTAGVFCQVIEDKGREILI